MNLKQIIAGMAVLIILVFGVNYVSGVKAEALEAEARVKILEEERMELERQVEEAAEGYEALLDSLSQAHDSIAEIRAEAVSTASEARVSFEEGIGVLRDSIQAYDGLETILDGIQENHEEEVGAYRTQIKTLELDKMLLTRRITTLESVWMQEQDLNVALRTEIAALNVEADAWEKAATITLVGRLGSIVPYALAGAGIVLLIR